MFRAEHAIPRRNRRGLIEALDANPDLTVDDARFPGEIAGASLKQFFVVYEGLRQPLIPRRNRRGLIEAPGVRERDRAGREEIPRRNRRGLIEARRGGIAHVRAWRGFPGEIAGASLKRPPGALTRAVSSPRFPGEIAGASLKRGAVRGLRRRGGGFPGEIAGASLKRPRPGRTFPGRRDDSPAKSPGPH